ncbi:phage major tail tube protein [Chromobacterium violaceum]|uniref:phage major tail tube protein n=1 Tax=Chromobacterium violaceum TaxID=536 RepID=UPI0005BE8747|nr:phage major tail tube protein [Chromobacterium violaceum]
MALPRTLRLFNVFVDGVSYIDQALEIKLPTIAMKTESFSGGGMIGSVKLLKMLEDIQIEHSYNGPRREIVATFGAEKHDAAMLRFAGSYSEEGTGTDQAVEIVVRGRHNEFDQGSAKTGENGDWKVKTDCTYYKQTIDGQVWLELDVVNKIFVVMGVDRLAAHRRNIGL